MPVVSQSFHRSGERGDMRGDSRMNDRGDRNGSDRNNNDRTEHRQGGRDML